MTTTDITTHRPTPEAATILFPPRRAARIAGVSYIVMFALAIFANLAVNQGVLDPDDPAATVANITGSVGMFRIGVLAFVVIAILDVAIAWALNVVFRHVDHDVSSAAAWFRIAYSAMLGVAAAALFQALQLAGGTFGLGTDRVAEQTVVAMSSFHTTWMFGLALFGVHLVLLGRLVARSGFAPKLLGYILTVAGVAYLADTIARVVLPHNEAVAALFLALVALPSMIGEGWFGLWLLVSRRVDR
jgi:hypothetical protein